tara:strand:+ start:1126 stop:2598 length:1473 start_codon:yes stop_codon:yes gene_type:complete
MKKQLKGLKSMNKIFRISLMVISLVFISCEIPENLNDHPTDFEVSEVDANLFLNGAQLANVIVQASHLNRISGMYSGQLVGYASLYSNIYGYSLSTVESNGEWNRAYIGVVQNTRHIQSIASEDKFMVGISKVLEAHAISTLAILMGDVPYSEIVSGDADGDGLTDILAPKFDSQKEVLNACIALLTSAVTDLNASSSRSEKYDIYFNGDKDKWILSAYTLKARISLVMKNYQKALEYANSGVINSQESMLYIPRGESNVSEGDKNLFYEILEGSRSEDIGNNGSYLMNLIDPSHSNYRGNSKTNEEARYNYYAIDENSGSDNLGIISQFEPQPLITAWETLLIIAETSARTQGFAEGLENLNNYRSWLNQGGRINSAYRDAAKYKYEDYVEADFANGGMENSDGVTKEVALLREIIEERYVSGFGTYMPFNDHRRLRGAGETNFIPPFPLNTDAATQHVERLPWAQDELITNPNKTEDPGLYAKTEVNQ